MDREFAESGVPWPFRSV